MPRMVRRLPKATDRPFPRRGEEAVVVWRSPERRGTAAACPATRYIAPSARAGHSHDFMRAEAGAGVSATTVIISRNRDSQRTDNFCVTALRRAIDFLLSGSP
jgi:hypothetical protein